MKTEDIAKEFIETAGGYIEDDYDSIDAFDISMKELHQLCTEYLTLVEVVKEQQAAIDMFRKALGEKDEKTLSAPIGEDLYD